MNTTAFRWLVLLLIPGCLLVQPLDAAKPDADDSGSSGKTSQAGSAGKHTGGNGSGTAGSPGTGGTTGAGATGNRAGSGTVPPGGADNGGSGGVDFSLFLGNWTIQSGKGTLKCDNGSGTQSTTADPGGVDTFGLGTVSDLIFDPGTACEILTDVSDRTASLNPATLPCETSDASYFYDLSFDTFQFVVSGDGKTAKASMTTSVDVYDTNDVFLSTCNDSYTWDYAR